MNTVTVGWATKIGLFLSALAALAPMIGELADSARPLNVPPDLWIKVSAVLAVTVVVGRMVQAVALIMNPPAQKPQESQPVLTDSSHG
jgi:hypothetical protein